MINVGIIGYGYWGPNLLRNFSSLSNATVIAVSDLDAKKLTLVKEMYPSLEVTTNYEDVLKTPKIDAIVIATPVSTHFEFAMQALAYNKHILVEKPMTSSTYQSLHLIEKAKRKNRVLLVDHTYLYTPSICKLKELIQKNDLGNLLYFDSTRTNLGLFQKDTNVAWDLAVHDLSILDYLVQEKPIEISATGVKSFPTAPENTAYITLFFNSNFIAHINVSWLSPIKNRTLILSGRKKTAVFDDMLANKLFLYDMEVTFKDKSVQYNRNEGILVKTNFAEALKAEAEHFIYCIENNVVPKTDGESGLRVVKTLEAINKSISRRGEIITL